MKHVLNAALLAAATLIAAVPTAAHATSYQSASFVSESTSGGDYYIDNTRFLGAVFNVNATEALRSIGGNFTEYGDGGSIFGAVVRLGAGDALPSDLAAATVSEVLFTPAAGEQAVSLSGVLTPGHYAVVFGSGLFGATGYSGLVSGQGLLAGAKLVQYMDDGSGTLVASAFNDDALRVTLVTSSVPEPSSALMVASSAALLLALRRARRQ